MGIENDTLFLADNEQSRDTYDKAKRCVKNCIHSTKIGCCNRFEKSNILEITY